MDTETVIAVGFVIHELLGLVGGLTLCLHRESCLFSYS
jgi:hypothetical protein